jgi:hypothetical protein
VPLPPLGEVLRVEIAGKEGFYLEPSQRFESGRRIEAAEQSAVPLEEIAREKGDGKTVVLLARPLGLVPAWLRVETRTGTLRRPVEVYDERQGSSDWRLGAATLYRLAGGRAEPARSPAPGAGEAAGRDRGRRQPGAGGLHFRRHPPAALVFELPADAAGGASGTLRFGGGRAAPHYDLDAFAACGRHRASRRRSPRSSATAPGSARDARPDPRQAAFDRKPALAFAMHAGPSSIRAPSAIAAVSRSRRREGLSRIALAPEDAALLRPDLADLRIVDDDAEQWPYLLSARGAGEQSHSRWWRARRRSGTRTSASSCPRRARVRRVSLRSAVAFFDRPFELSAEDEHGRHRVVAHGRLVKQALRLGPVEVRSAERRCTRWCCAWTTATTRRSRSSRRRPTCCSRALRGGAGGPLRDAARQPRRPGAALRARARARRRARGGNNPASPGALEENPLFSLRARLGATTVRRTDAKRPRVGRAARRGGRARGADLARDAPSAAAALSCRAFAARRCRAPSTTTSRGARSCAGALPAP